MKIVGISRDNGDGSSSILWFKDLELAQSLMDDNEDFYANEGCGETLTFPDDLNLEECGFSFSDESYK